MKEASVDLFSCAESFAGLKAWHRVLIGADPDIRKANFLSKTRVIHNWPSQWHSTFPEGYIALENGERFDLKNHTISRVKVYIFRCSEINEAYFRKRLAINKIVERLTGAPKEDLRAVQELLLEAAGLAPRLAPRFWWDRRGAEREIIVILFLLGPKQLRDLEDLLAFDPGRDEASCPPKAAA
jgi:hypothetical protein